LIARPYASFGRKPRIELPNDCQGVRIVFAGALHPQHFALDVIVTMADAHELILGPDSMNIEDIQYRAFGFGGAGTLRNRFCQ
jgi:hypothetical protein